MALPRRPLPVATADALEPVNVYHSAPLLGLVEIGINLREEKDHIDYYETYIARVVVHRMKMYRCTVHDASPDATYLGEVADDDRQLLMDAITASPFAMKEMDKAHAEYRRIRNR